MTPQRLVCFVVLLAALFAHPLQAQHTVVIRFVRNTSEFDGAGCSLWLPADHSHSDRRYIFISDLDDHAIMNINGRDVQLKPAGSTERKSEAKKGDRTIYRYRGDGVEVVVNYTVTGVCAPNDESCEATKYGAAITVTSGSAKRVVAAQGVCGS